MENYLLFLLVATVTVLSPGPGVVLTLTNSLRYGVIGALPGILGISFGTFIVAGVSATSLGIVLATSSIAFTIMKYLGACYLIYLGVKLWRSPSMNMDSLGNSTPNKVDTRFFEGLLLQLTNPKAVFFFLSVFPQFVNFSSTNINQFTILVVTYVLLVLGIHIAYAYLANSAKIWFLSSRGASIINKVGGGTFICFGAGLATTQK